MLPLSDKSKTKILFSAEDLPNFLFHRSDEHLSYNEGKRDTTMQLTRNCDVTAWDVTVIRTKILMIVNHNAVIFKSANQMEEILIVWYEN